MWLGRCPQASAAHTRGPHVVFSGAPLLAGAANRLVRHILAQKVRLASLAGKHTCLKTVVDWGRVGGRWLGLRGVVGSTRLRRLCARHSMLSLHVDRH